MDSNRDVERDFIYLLLSELAIAAAAQKNYALADLIGLSIEEIRWGLEQDDRSKEELLGAALEGLTTETIPLAA